MTREEKRKKNRKKKEKQKNQFFWRKHRILNPSFLPYFLFDFFLLCQKRVEKIMKK